MGVEVEVAQRSVRWDAHNPAEELCLVPLIYTLFSLPSLFLNLFLLSSFLLVCNSTWSCPHAPIIHLLIPYPLIHQFTNQSGNNLHFFLLLFLFFPYYQHYSMTNFLRSMLNDQLGWKGGLVWRDNNQESFIKMRSFGRLYYLSQFTIISDFFFIISPVACYLTCFFILLFLFTGFFAFISG